MDSAGNVYVAGFGSSNAFQIDPNGITEIIDASGDLVSLLGQGLGLAVDGSGNVYIGGFGSDNVFKIEFDEVCGNGIV